METKLSCQWLPGFCQIGWVGRDRVWSRDLTSWAICSHSPIATSSSGRGGDFTCHLLHALSNFH